MQLNKNFHDQHLLFGQQLFHNEDPTIPLHSDLKTQGDEGVRQGQEYRNDEREARFYLQHKKIYVISYHLYLEQRRQAELLAFLNKRIKLLDDRMRDAGNDEGRLEISAKESKGKRSRRTAQMIEKKHRCSVPLCDKSYGSEGSLQQHIKLKHPHLYVRGQNEDESGEYSNSSQ